MILIIFIISFSFFSHYFHIISSLYFAVAILLAVIDCCTGQDRGPDAKAIARLLVDNILAGEHRAVLFCFQETEMMFSLGHPGGKKGSSKAAANKFFGAFVQFHILIVLLATDVY